MTMAMTTKSDGWRSANGRALMLLNAGLFRIQRVFGRVSGGKRRMVGARGVLSIAVAGASAATGTSVTRRGGIEMRRGGVRLRARENEIQIDDSARSRARETSSGRIGCYRKVDCRFPAKSW